MISFFFSLLLYQSVAHWSRVASSFCCCLNRLVLDDRSKILTTSGEKRALPAGEGAREAGQIYWAASGGDAPLDKGKPCLTARFDQVRISASHLCQYLFFGIRQPVYNFLYKDFKRSLRIFFIKTDNFLIIDYLTYFEVIAYTLLLVVLVLVLVVLVLVA